MNKYFITLFCITALHTPYTIAKKSDNNNQDIPTYVFEKLDKKKNKIINQIQQSSDKNTIKKIQYSGVKKITKKASVLQNPYFNTSCAEVFIAFSAIFKAICESEKKDPSCLLLLSLTGLTCIMGYTIINNADMQDKIQSLVKEYEQNINYEVQKRIEELKLLSKQNTLDSNTSEHNAAQAQLYQEAAQSNVASHRYNAHEYFCMFNFE